VDGVNNQYQKEIANAINFVLFAKEVWVKEWLSGVNIVGMVVMQHNIINGLNKIKSNFVLMGVDIIALLLMIFDYVINYLLLKNDNYMPIK
jgi:hypothetical protein